MKKIIFVGAMLIVGLAHSQVGIGTRAPAKELNPDTIAIDYPQGILHLQGQHYQGLANPADSTSVITRNLGLVVPRVNMLTDTIVTPDGSPAVKGTMIFDTNEKCLRVKTSDGYDGWNAPFANCLVPEVDFDLTTVTESYEGLTVNAKKVSAGNGFSLIISADDDMLYAAGLNTNGRTGLGVTANNTPSFKMVLARVVTDISAGYQHGLAVDSIGNVWSWGSGANYRTAQASTGDFTFPRKITKGVFADIPSKLKAVRVEAGYASSLVLCSDGKVYTFGVNTNGLNGNEANNTTNVTTPTAISGLTHIKDIAISQFSGAAIDSTGKVYVWGNQRYGRLGNNGPNTNTVVGVTPITFPYPIKQIALGSANGVAFSEDGKHLYGWGQAQAWGQPTAEIVTSPREITDYLRNQPYVSVSDQFNPASDTILYVAAGRFLATGNYGTMVITTKNVYSAGNNATAGGLLGLGVAARDGATTATARFSPQTINNVGAWYNLDPIYRGTIYPSTQFGQASMGATHTLLLQRAVKEDGFGNIIRNKDGSIAYQGLGYGTGACNTNQFGAVDASYSPIYIFSLLKK